METTIIENTPTSACTGTASPPAGRPKIHGLIRLAELADIVLADEQKDLLAIFTQYNLAGRYPDTLGPVPTQAESMARMREVKGVYEWLLTL